MRRQRLLATERERKNFSREVIRAITRPLLPLGGARRSPTIRAARSDAPLEDEESYRTIRELNEIGQRAAHG